ncbi:MAG: hypothetical protein HOG03_16415 [Desulfobacula sp.]|jgi:predicted alpha/beta hydrolase family esterase|uniref:hypothetical protein n=1 Tax=Desulfobacula sp. TaxID=2593537 RepID=UPI001EB96625|nr:hypothetical protein [Desulfobacula sp.]MBT4968573.1 hypothetical protein [Bacteroidota bacterium]MBT5546518.1 hypothetical protein [Desulfobacula sp.]
MNNTVYLIPGRGKKLDCYIGDIINSLGFDVCGREIISPFSNRHFPAQLDTIKKDLTSLFWNIESKLIGHSYGSYLLMHALAELKPFPGKILLFSPVLGAAINIQRLYSSRPPRADKLLELAKANKFPTPQSLDIHTGADDNGCDHNLAERIGSSISTAKVNILQNQGHKLSNAYIKKTIREFL